MHHLVLGDSTLQSTSIVVIAGKNSSREVLLNVGTMVLQVVLEIWDEELLQGLEGFLTLSEIALEAC